MASFIYQTRTTTRFLLHNFRSPNPVIALLQTKSPISLPPASKPSNLCSHLPADNTFSHHISFPKILLNLSPLFVQHHSISTTDTKSQEPDSDPPTLLENPHPEFRHQEITGPTVERDVSALANETREVLGSLRNSVYDLSYTLAVLGVAHLGLGAWIAYAVQPPSEVSVQGFAAFAVLTPLNLFFRIDRRKMDTGVATWPIARHVHPKLLRLGLDSVDVKSPTLFPALGRLSFPRRWKHLCLVGEGNRLSPFNDKPYEVLPGGRISYLDEQDIASFVDPPKELIPLDPESYNPAAYLWKKIGDVPEERRHRLLSTLKPRHIPKLWELTGTRYQDAKLAKQTASALLSMDGHSMTPEYWRCRTSKGPLLFSWLNDFRKAIFHGKDGGTYGRLVLGGTFPSTASKFYGPLYFKARQVVEIMPTEQPCDLAYELGDGLLDLTEYPEGFPSPAKHPWPFDDHVVIYIRHAGPGVVVGQAWQEGKDLEQVPKKLCGEILMVKEYITSSEQ